MREKRRRSVNEGRKESEEEKEEGGEKVKGGDKNATLHRLESCLASFNTHNTTHIQH